MFIPLFISLAAIVKPLVETPPTVLSQKPGAPRVLVRTDEEKKKKSEVVVSEQPNPSEEKPQEEGAP